jgi:hypothetical protein
MPGAVWSTRGLREPMVGLVEGLCIAGAQRLDLATTYPKIVFPGLSKSYRRANVREEKPSECLTAGAMMAMSDCPVRGVYCRFAHGISQVLGGLVIPNTDSTLSVYFTCGCLDSSPVASAVVTEKIAPPSFFRVAWSWRGEALEIQIPRCLMIRLEVSLINNATGLPLDFESFDPGSSRNGTECRPCSLLTISSPLDLIRHVRRLRLTTCTL